MAHPLGQVIKYPTSGRSETLSRDITVFGRWQTRARLQSGCICLFIDKSAKMGWSWDQTNFKTMSFKKWKKTANTESDATGKAQRMRNKLGVRTPESLLPNKQRTVLNFLWQEIDDHIWNKKKNLWIARPLFTPGLCSSGHFLSCFMEQNIFPGPACHKFCPFVSEPGLIAFENLLEGQKFWFFWPLKPQKIQTISALWSRPCCHRENSDTTFQVGYRWELFF